MIRVSEHLTEDQDMAEKESKPLHPLPTNRIAFPKQLDILRAFGAASEAHGRAVTNIEVAAVVEMSPATISLANPFFVDIGLLEKTGDGFMPSPEVAAMKRAHEWNAESAPYKLAPLLMKSWFGQALMPKLRFRPLPAEEAVHDLAEAATAGKQYQGQLELLLEYLQIAGVIQRENGAIKLLQVSTDQQRQEPAQQSSAAAPSADTREQTAHRHSSVATSFANPTAGLVQFQISVKVDMQEMANWRPDRIQAFFAGIAQVLAAKGSIEEEASQTSK